MPAPPAHTRIPESLRPYIRLPRRDTLTLVTGVLGATTNWIVLRFIGAAAAAATAATTAGDGGSKIERGSSGEDSTDHKQGQDQSQGQTQKQTPTVAVVLVSWMRDMEFWRTEGMKVVVSLFLFESMSSSCLSLFESSLYLSYILLTCEE